MREKHPIRLAYILAASHSGSTLLTMLLNVHPAAATVGELAPEGIGNPVAYRCSCGSLIRECAFWTWLVEQAGKRGVLLDVGDLGTAFTMPGTRLGRRLLASMHRGPLLESVRDICLRLLTPWPRRFQQIAAANALVIQLCLARHSASVFVDKGQSALRLKHLLRIPSLDVRVLHMVRDGRAVALTYMNESEYADATVPSMRGGGRGRNRAERKSMRQAAYEVRRDLEAAEHVLRRVQPSRQCRLRYEDLCADPDATIAGMLEFIGLDPGGREADFRLVEHHILGNGMRLDSGSEIWLDERWKSVLTDGDLQTFDAIAGRAYRAYGYE